MAVDGRGGARRVTWWRRIEAEVRLLSVTGEHHTLGPLRPPLEHRPRLELLLLLLRGLGLGLGGLELRWGRRGLMAVRRWPTLSR